MKKVNLAHVRAEQRQSPGGKYAKTIKEISVALGPGMSWTFELPKETLKALAKQQLSRIGLPDLSTH
jgi:hypothetical protein